MSDISIGSFGRTMSIIIGPAPDDGVKVSNYFFSFGLLVTVQIVFDAMQVSRSDQKIPKIIGIRNPQLRRSSVSNTSLTELG